ncbi:1-phosphatidylinositol 3-phosphate 5-kinase FAB1 [Phytophthora cinnamomi]|uniref:1-phosphatidylinositol 3-phosphate 5-kinase FAB1 n=1 Tax=Phytophthora cinnamomi TaxID=4785 RepID=UPI00355AC523|nr:1-phosphatidylinositol 3-phosphate 5-kinase FAB1 [Phytophthora cinnamomi]
MSSTSSDQAPDTFAARASKVNTFPVPDDYFPDVPLSALQILELEEKMMLTVKNALAEYDMHEAMGPNPSYGKGWKTLGSVADLTTVRQTGDAARCQCRIFGRLNGDYRNFINFFYSETSSQLFAWNQIIYGNAVDAAVLKNIHTSSSGKPHLYLGIKWTCLQPFALVKKRDTCFLEYMAFTKDLRGRDIGVRVNMPLTLPECPPLPGKMKTKRMQMLIVSIVRPTDGDPRSTELLLMSQNDFAGFAVPGFYFKRLMAKLNDMAVYVDAKLILIHGMMKRSCWADKKARSECRLCSREFSTIRRRQHCRLCGEVFCRQCLVHRGARQGEEDGDNTQRTFNVVKTKFCRVCLAKVRDLDVTLLAPGKHDKPATLSMFADSGASTKPDGSELLETIRSSGDRDDGFVDDDERSDLDGSSRTGPSIGVDMSNLMSASQMMRRINAGAFPDDNSAHYQPTAPGTTNSRRTISQCIAEQEELLKRLMLAAQDRAQL